MVRIILLLLIPFLMIRYGGRSGRWFGGGGAVFVLILVGLFFFARVSTVSHSQSAMNSFGNERPTYIVPRVFSQAHSSSDYVDPNDRQANRSQTNQLNPETYPTVTTAAVQCATKLLKESGLDINYEHPALVEIEGPNGETLAPVIAALQKDFQYLRIEAADDAITTTQPASKDHVQIMLKLTPLGRDADGIATATLVQAEYQSARRGATCSARAVDKLWVEDLAQWRAQTGDDTLSIVVDPSLLGANPQEVGSNALAQAAARIAPYIKTESFRQDLDYAALENFLISELRSGHLVKDEFLQRFDRPYGQVYREALLIDVSEPQMSWLAGKYANMNARDRMHSHRRIGSLAALAFLILVVYLFLNAATKGYYAWSLRVAAFVLIAGVFFTVHMMRL